MSISTEKTFYVARGPWDAPLSASLANQTTSSALTNAFEEHLKLLGVPLANSSNAADYIIIPSFQLEGGSAVALFEPNVESFNMIVYENATSTVVIGAVKECCSTVKALASESAGMLHKILHHKVSYPPVLAQSPVTDDPCTDAKHQFELDLDQKSWGPIYPEQIVSPKIEDPSATVLVGKNISYLTSYLDCYHREVKDMKVRRALLGCAAGCLVVAVLNPWTLAMLMPN